MKRDFKGIWIPKEIWLNKKLTVMEKLFLVEIDSLDNEDGCFASNAHFSELFGVTKGRCTQIMKSLERKHFVKITIIRDGKIISKRVVKMLNTLVKKLNTPSEKIKLGYLENAQGNNTSINNTYIQKACANDLQIYSKELGSYFGKTSEEQQMKVYGFLNAQVKDKLPLFKMQFEAYKKYKELSKEKIHRFESFCNEWDQQDWSVLLKNVNAGVEKEVIPLYRKKIS